MRLALLAFGTVPEPRAAFGDGTPDFLPMRFVFLTLGYHPDLDGGGYRYATEVAERLAERGHEVHAVYPNPKNQFATHESRRGVELHRIPDGTRGFVANYRSENAAAHRKLKELLAPGSARTLLATHQAYFGPASQDWPTLFMYQGPWGMEYAFSQQAKPRGRLRRWMDPWIGRRLHSAEGAALKRAPEVFVASEYTRRQLPKWHPAVKSPIEVISGGANFQQFHPPIDRNADRATRGLHPDDFVFLTVRRLDPRMGLMVLLDAFAQAVRDNPKAKLLLAGRGPQQAELADRSQKADLGGRVQLLGFVPESELSRIYGLADCTLMPSLDLEGFGLATVESLACGTPVLASDAGANPELVGPLDRDLLFPSANLGVLAQRLGALVSGQQALPSRTRCAEYAREAFPWERPVSAFEGAWDRHATMRSMR